MKESIVQFIKFGIVGASNTIISYAVYLMGLHFGLHYLLSGVLGFVVSVMNAFYWQQRYVFKQEGERLSLIKTFFKTFLSYAGTGLVLSNILLIIVVEILNWPKWFAPLADKCITIPLNFILNKWWAYKR